MDNATTTESSRLTLPCPAPAPHYSPRVTWLRLALIRCQDLINALHNAGMAAPDAVRTMNEIQDELDKLSA